jgi:hypothetical protein
MFGRLHLRIETRDGKSTVLRALSVWPVVKKPRVGLSPRGQHGPVSAIRARRRWRKPAAMMRALTRAWKMNEWGCLYDPEVPF